MDETNTGSDRNTNAPREDRPPFYKEYRGSNRKGQRGYHQPNAQQQIPRSAPIAHSKLFVSFICTFIAFNPNAPPYYPQSNVRLVNIVDLTPNSTNITSRVENTTAVQGNIANITRRFAFSFTFS